ncbi:YraN family protein [Glycomyces sp. NEAU-7082]|uniref:UPF0102 protein GFD30_23180 n=1 Tax=Glycomyces albidus TaxID=2656774 RepID=A0A6L5GFH8_9ACTN|nr:YraN family protein [Glycomyces albidus]
MTPHQLGRLGERLAAAHLQRHRMQILARNWRHRTGELDLVARAADTVVVCEVKTRRSERFGGPLGAVDGEKRRRVERLARAWLREHCRPDQPWRLDRVALTVTGTTHLSLEHREGARRGLRAHEHRLHGRRLRRRGHRRGVGVQVLRQGRGHRPHVGPARQRRQPGPDAGPVRDGELRAAVPGQVDQRQLRARLGPHHRIGRRPRARRHDHVRRRAAAGRAPRRRGAPRGARPRRRPATGPRHAPGAPGGPPQRPADRDRRTGERRRGGHGRRADDPRPARPRDPRRVGLRAGAPRPGPAPAGPGTAAPPGPVRRARPAARAPRLGDRRGGRPPHAHDRPAGSGEDDARRTAPVDPPAAHGRRSGRSDLAALAPRPVHRRRGRPPPQPAVRGAAPLDHHAGPGRRRPRRRRAGLARARPPRRPLHRRGPRVEPVGPGLAPPTARVRRSAHQAREHLDQLPRQGDSGPGREPVPVRAEQARRLHLPAAEAPGLSRADLAAAAGPYRPAGAPAAGAAFGDPDRPHQGRALRVRRETGPAGEGGGRREVVRSRRTVGPEQRSPRTGAPIGPVASGAAGAQERRRPAAEGTHHRPRLRPDPEAGVDDRRPARARRPDRRRRGRGQ